MPNIFKRIRKAFFLLSFLLFSCGSEVSSSMSLSSESSFNVTIVDGDGFSVDANTKKVAKGKDAFFELTFETGKDYASSSYPGARYISPKGGKGTLILPCITYPLRVEVFSFETAFSITYFANGGEIAYSDAESYTLSYCPKNHLRSNVSIGTDYLSRDGYTLTGWNSKADGSGERTGLGSRISFVEGERKHLYAIWAKQLPEKDFDAWQNEEGRWTIRGYRGETEIDEFAIPSHISSIPVDLIETGAFSHLNCKSVILPPTITEVREKAFTSCSDFDLYLYDSITGFGEDPFGGSVKRFFANAILPPCFLDKTYEPALADRVDSLLLSQGENRLILFAGCSLAYAIDSPRIEREFGGRYRVFDFSVTGDTGGLFQFQILEAILGEKDTLVHFPEPGSPFQLLYDHSVDNRAFMAVEGNLDLLSYVNPNELPRFFSNFASFNDLRKNSSLSPCSYEDDCFVFDEYGDYVGEGRTNMVEDAVYNGGQYTFEMSFANQLSCDNLSKEYAKLRDLGVKGPYFSYSPINISGLPKKDREGKVWERYAENYENPTSGLPHSGFKVLGEVESSLFNGKYFFDADYHLNIYGRDLFTDYLLPVLKSELL